MWGKNINRGNGSKSVVGNPQTNFKSRRASRGGNEAEQKIAANKYGSKTQIIEN